MKPCTRVYEEDRGGVVHCVLPPTALRRARIQRPERPREGLELVVRARGPEKALAEVRDVAFELRRSIPLGVNRQQK